MVDGRFVAATGRSTGGGRGHSAEQESLLTEKAIDPAQADETLEFDLTDLPAVEFQLPALELSESTEDEAPEALSVDAASDVPNEMPSLSEEEWSIGEALPQLGSLSADEAVAADDQIYRDIA